MRSKHKEHKAHKVLNLEPVPRTSSLTPSADHADDTKCHPERSRGVSPFSIQNPKPKILYPWTSIGIRLLSPDLTSPLTAHLTSALTSRLSPVLSSRVTTELKPALSTQLSRRLTVKVRAKLNR